MQLQVVFTRHATRDGWTNLGRYEDDVEKAKERYSHYYLHCRYRDYVVRCRDEETGHIFAQCPPTAGAVLDTSPVAPALYPLIEWNLPESRITLTGEIKHMIKVGVRRIDGKLKLLVNAKEFHDELDTIGCTHANGKYNDRPSTGNTIASSGYKMSTEVLLTRDYREVEVIETKKIGETVVKTATKVPVTACFDLSGIWTNPPSFEQLKTLCNSANDAARKILEHYQPIDIQVEIHKKVVK